MRQKFETATHRCEERVPDVNGFNDVDQASKAPVVKEEEGNERPQQPE